MAHSYIWRQAADDLSLHGRSPETYVPDDDPHPMVDRILVYRISEFHGTSLAWHDCGTTAHHEPNLEGRGRTTKSHMKPHRILAQSSGPGGSEMGVTLLPCPASTDHTVLLQTQERFALSFSL